MKKGFIIGKFMPPHSGHLALIEFGSRHCDILSVIVCFTENEPIPGIKRTEWMIRETEKFPNVNVVPLQYDEAIFPNTSASSREVSRLWAGLLGTIVPDAQIVFSSEPYGEYLASYMQIEHISFDEKRIKFPVSATQARTDPFSYWNWIAEAARPYFVKKIALVGTESTGKTTLAERLAKHYNTVFVPEMARNIIEKTNECRYEDLEKIASLHASAILEKIQKANRLFFADTDLTITESYSRFLFNKSLSVREWIREANRFDCYLFLEPDCDYVQDGTRLTEAERNRLHDHHRLFFIQKGISFISIGGNWEERFRQSLIAIDSFLNEKGDCG